METPDPYDPSTRETSLPTSSDAAEGALSAEEPLSAYTSSTLYDFPPTSMVGVSAFAYCIPRISFFPPDAESPVEGSNTPILMVSPPEEPPEAAPPAAPPQATNPKVIIPVSITANIFFIN